MRNKKLFIIGVDHETHVGRQLKKSADKLGIPCFIYDSRQAYKGLFVLKKLKWFLDKKPNSIRTFSQNVLHKIQKSRPDLILSTGIAPLETGSLKEIKKQGIFVTNYSTDDPWNTAHRAEWFLKTLPYYNTVFSTRRANLDEFRCAGVEQVKYLPFGYDPGLYFPDDVGLMLDVRRNEETKVFLAGGGDVDRYPLVKALKEAGIGLSLWGGYWEKAGLPSGGFLDAAEIRREAARCMVSLILVRRANRDGSAMRSFEIPACGACCVAEDTEEHREMFGPNGEAVLYFRTPEELVRRVNEAFGNPELRAKLRRNAHRAITGKPNTYVDRLRSILEAVGENSRQDAKVAK